MARKSKKSFLVKAVEKKLTILDSLAPIADIMLRVWVALIFWRSGLSKVASMETTVFLFEDEYKTHEKLTLFGNQIISPEFAAYSATAAELILPILLVLGLFTRGAAFALLLMTAVIEFTYQSFPQHTTWAIVLGAILLRGAGRFSWDYFIKANYFGFPKNEKDIDKLLATFGVLCVTVYSGYLIFTGFNN